MSMKHSKNIFAGLICLLVFMLPLSGCRHAERTRLAEMCLEEGDNLPWRVAADCQVSGFEYDMEQNAVTCVITAFPEEEDPSEQKIWDSFAELAPLYYMSFEAHRQFGEQILRAGASFTSEIQDRDHKVLSTHVFERGQLKEVLDNQPSYEEASLRLIAGMGRATCPEEMSDAIVLTDIILTPENLIYECTYDEDLRPLDEEIDREAFMESFRLMMGQEWDLLKATNRGFIFRTIGNKSGRTIDFAFSNEEL